jgi:hypothetical protein
MKGDVEMGSSAKIESVHAAAHRVDPNTLYPS